MVQDEAAPQDMLLEPQEAHTSAQVSAWASCTACYLQWQYCSTLAVVQW